MTATPVDYPDLILSGHGRPNLSSISRKRHRALAVAGSVR
jgi:hypothetical protein